MTIDKEKKDKFHTNSTRLGSEMRDRLKVERLPSSEDLYDYDEPYFNEFHNEGWGCDTEFHFKRITEISKMRESLRMKFSTYYIREYLNCEAVKEKMKSEIEQNIAETMDVYEKVLGEIKEKSHRESMKSKRKRNEESIRTNELRNVLRDLEKKMPPLLNRIFSMSLNFVKMSILQNFQFLIMPLDWRNENDFLHRNQAGELETYHESLRKRTTANLWDRNNDDVATIMEFYKTTFLKRKQKQIIPLPDCQAFMDRLNDIKKVTQKNLWHFQEFLDFLDQSTLQEVHVYSKNKKELRNSTESSGKWQETPENPVMSKSQCEMLHQTIEIRSEGILKDSKDDEINVKLSKIEEKVNGLLEKLDGIPKDVLEEVLQESEKSRSSSTRSFLSLLIESLKD